METGPRGLREGSRAEGASRFGERPSVCRPLSRPTDAGKQSSKLPPAHTSASSDASPSRSGSRFSRLPSTRSACSARSLPSPSGRAARRQSEARSERRQARSQSESGSDCSFEPESSSCRRVEREPAAAAEARSGRHVPLSSTKSASAWRARLRRQGGELCLSEDEGAEPRQAARGGRKREEDVLREAEVLKLEACPWRRGARDGRTRRWTRGVGEADDLGHSRPLSATLEPSRRGRRAGARGGSPPAGGSSAG